MGIELEVFGTLYGHSRKPSKCNRGIYLFTCFLEKMPMKRALKGVEKREEGQFLAFQLKQLIGWTAPDFSDFARGNYDLSRNLEHLLFPSEIVFRRGLPIANRYWDHVTMSYMT